MQLTPIELAERIESFTDTLLHVDPQLLDEDQLDRLQTATGLLHAALEEGAGRSRADFGLNDRAEPVTIDESQGDEPVGFGMGNDEFAKFMDKQPSATPQTRSPAPSHAVSSEAAPAPPPAEMTELELLEAVIDPERDVGISGSHDSLAMRTVMEHLATGSNSGSLLVQTQAELLTFEFDGGEIVFTESNQHPPDRYLGEIITSVANVPAQQLRAFVENYAGEAPLGQALALKGYIDEVGLRGALVKQTKDRFKRVIEAEQYGFAFYPGPARSPDQRLRTTILELTVAASMDN